MMIRGLLVSAILAAWVTGTGSQGAAADSRDQGWIVLKISRVQVKPRKVDGTTWDLPSEKKSSDCGLVGIIGKATLGPAGGAVATFLCSQSAGAGRERDFSAPDLFVQVVAGDAKYRTPAALDTFAEAFDFSLIVPLDGIPAAGLELQVLDQDADVGAGELIGMARATRRQIQDAIAAGTPLLTLSDSQTEKIEIEVSQYSMPAPVRQVKLEANHEPIAVATRALAGELVTIRASGKYGVANDDKELIDQHGYVGGQKRGYNRPHFENANHAAAIAYVGPPTASHTALVVGSCVTAVTPVPGQIHVGVNDTDVSNNQGSLVFEVQRALPTLEQWRSGGAFGCSERATSSTTDALRSAPARSLPLDLDRQTITDGVAKVKPEILACGSQFAAKGMVRVRVTVGADGRVGNVAIEGTSDTALGACIAATLKKIVFPATQNGGSFGYPFVF